MQKKYAKQEGFVALTGAIIISFLLMAVSLNLALAEYWSQSNSLDSVLKERSLSLAEGCFNMAILESSNNTYSIEKTINVTSNALDVCQIVSSQKNTPAHNQTLIKTQASFGKSTTNLKAVIDNRDFSVISLEECANLTSC